MRKITKKDQPRTNWESPLQIPEGKIGEWAIQHQVVPAGEPVMMGNMRTRFFGQDAPTSVEFDHPTTWHLLTEGSARWMSDWPIEQRQIDDLLKGFKGKVLVGGLGLGYAAHVLAYNPRVKSVTVVEISPEVIQLVEPYLCVNDPKARAKITVVQQDLLKYLEDMSKAGWSKEVFNQAFYDIWASDGEGTFHKVIVPLHQLSRACVKERPLNWNEDIMRGQGVSSLISRLMMLYYPEILPEGTAEYFKAHPLWEPDGTDQPWWNWSCPFFQWWHEKQPTEEQAQDAARHYAGLYGLVGWEQLWKWVILTKL